MSWESLVGELTLLIIIYGLQASLIMDHPMVHGAMLLTVGVLSCGVISIWAGPLFAALYFLVLVGGVLIVFAYSISLVPYNLGEKDESEASKASTSEVWDTCGSLAWFVVVCGILFWGIVVSPKARWGAYSYSWLMYFSSDWGVATVIIGIMLLLLMISVVGVAAAYKGALVSGKSKKSEKKKGAN